jgi:hypothetical protein
MDKKYGITEIMRLIELSEEERLITPEWVDSTMEYYRDQIEILNGRKAHAI